MEENKEAVVEETTQAPIKEEPKVDDTVEKIKVKKKPSMKKFNNDPDGVTKVDLSKPLKTEQTTDIVEEKQTEVVQEVVEEKQDQKEKEEVVLEEVTDEEIEEKTEELAEKSRRSYN